MKYEQHILTICNRKDGIIRLKWMSPADFHASHVRFPARLFFLNFATYAYELAFCYIVTSVTLIITIFFCKPHWALLKGSFPSYIVFLRPCIYYRLYNNILLSLEPFFFVRPIYCREPRVTETDGRSCRTLIK